VSAVREADRLASWLLEQLSVLGPVSARRMFGGVGLFHRGVMFGLIAREELYFKVGDANRPAYEAAGEAAFTYETRKGVNTLHSYWRCPPDLLDDGETLRAWARAAIDASGKAAKQIGAGEPEPVGSAAGPSRRVRAGKP
jgi:DNA transformation protein and related proteins